MTLQRVNLSAVMRGFAAMIGASTGCIVGAIAGLASSSRLDKPLVPLWVLLVVVAAMLLLMVGALAWYSMAI
jgi:phage shock protein PspC (stress-responsive transcriptional regulator)